MLKVTLIVITAFIGIMLYTGNCQATSVERTPDDFINKNHKKIEKIIKSNKPIENMRQDIREHMDEFVDFTKFASLTVPRQWPLMKKKKQEEFARLLKNIVSKNYSNKFKPCKNLKIDYIGETEYREEKARIKTNVTTGDITSYVEYRMHQPTSTSEWWVYDIIIDDVSMMRNYRRQFYIMLKKGDTIDTIMKSMHDGAMK